MFASGCFKTSCCVLFTVRWDNVDFHRICGGRERDSEKTAHLGRITKIVDCIQIVFGLSYNYKPNLSAIWAKPFSQRNVCCVTVFSIQIGVMLQNQTHSLRTLYRRTVKKTTWSNLQYNKELFYFSLWVFETPNKRARIYHERACEREYLQRNENW